MRDVGHFLTTLKTYADAINRGTLSNPAVIFAAVDEYLAMPNIDRATIERRSHAAAGICEWVINIRKYYDVYREVDPKRKRLRVEETRLAKSEMRLSNARLHLRKVKEQLLTQQGIQRIDSKVGPPYWFSSLTGESVWEPPTALSRLLERRLKARETLREERKHRMGKIRRRMKAKLSVQAQGIRMGGGKKIGVGNTDFL